MKKLIFSAASNTLLATSILTPLASASESQEPTNQDQNSQIINKTNKLPNIRDYLEKMFLSKTPAAKNICWTPMSIALEGITPIITPTPWIET